MIDDESVSLGLLEEEIFKRMDEPPNLEEKHQQILYRFAMKCLARRNVKKIESRRNALGNILLEISKRSGMGMLTAKIAVSMINQIKGNLLEVEKEVEDHGVKHKHSEIGNLIRMEKLDQQLADAKYVLSLSKLERYDKQMKERLSNLVSLWKDDPNEVKGEDEGVEDGEKLL